jgi:hypothetical protein
MGDAKMRIDASHEFGTETWEQRARACAADLEEAKGNITALVLQNETLIIHAGEMEIVIQEQAEKIRDLETEVEAWKIWAASTKEKHAALEAEYLRLNKLPWKQAAKRYRMKANGNLMAVYDAKAEKYVELLRANRAEEQLKEANALLDVMGIYPCDFCESAIGRHDSDCEYAAYFAKWRKQP